jgi:hypothetical protein
MDAIQKEVDDINKTLGWCELEQSILSVVSGFTMGFPEGAVLDAEEGVAKLGETAIKDATLKLTTKEGATAIEQTLEKTGEEVTGALMSVGSKAAGALDGIDGALKILQKDGNVLLDVGKGAEQAVCKITETGMKIAGSIENGVVQIADKVEGDIMKVVDAGQNAIMNLKTEAEAIGGSVLELAGEVKSAGMQVIDGIDKTLLAVGKDVEGAITQLRHDGMTVKGDVEALAHKIKSIKKDEADFVIQAKKNAKEAVYTFGNDVKEVVTEIQGKFKAGTLTFEDLKNGATQIWTSVEGVAQKFYSIYHEGQVFIQSYANAVKLIYKDCTQTFNNLKQNFINAKGELIGGIEAVWVEGKTAIKHIADHVQTIVKQVGDGVNKVEMGVKTFIGEGEKVFHNIQADVFNTVVQTKGEVEHGLSSFMDGVNSVVKITTDRLNIFGKDFTH